MAKNTVFQNTSCLEMIDVTDMDAIIEILRLHGMLQLGNE